MRTLTQSTDLMPTILDVLNVSVPDSVQGKSLLRHLDDKTVAGHEYVAMGLQVGDEIEHGLRTAEWAFLAPYRPGEDEEDEARCEQLYVKPDDRWEVHNVIQSYSAVAEACTSFLREVIAGSEHGELPPL